MIVELAYGSGRIPVEFPDDRTTVIEPAHNPGLTNERGAFLEALRKPIASRPLRELARDARQICILFTDLTRATPNERIIPWLLDELAEVSPEQITLLNQLGTHRPNTAAELERMLTPEVVRRYRVLNHEPENPEAVVPIGNLRDGTPALLNRHAIEADLRIVTGFIEPHFFAGFSGGPKGLIPGVAALSTVMGNHRAANIGDPRAAFGITEGNPLWEELRDMALRAGPSFLVNVTLNEARAITGVFAGDLIEAHRAGCGHVRASAMRRVNAPFDVVVTTNSGYPLDLNLYQGVKGMCAAERIVKDGGVIILACECREGLPPASPFARLLQSAENPSALLGRINAPGFAWPEQWQVQIQARIQQRATVMVHSQLGDAELGSAHLLPCPDIAAAVRSELQRLGEEARVAVLPLGPLTIPYLA